MVDYIEKGNIKLTITSRQGKEAMLSILGEGEFFGESCIASDRPLRIHTAVALTDLRLLKIDRSAIIRALGGPSHPVHAFVSSLIRHNIGIQRDLAHSLFDTSGERLARAVLTISRLYAGRTPPFPRITS